MTIDASNGEGTNTPLPNEQLNYQTAEQYLDVAPTSTATQTVACPFGYMVADGSAWVQSVDQPGQPADVQTLTSEASDQMTWTFTLRNPDAGHAHVQLEIDCISDQTNTGVQLPYMGAQETTVTTAPSYLTQPVLYCPPGSAVIAAGYSIGGSGNSPLNYSEPYKNSTAWEFGFMSQAGGDPVTASIHCIKLKLSDGSALVNHASYDRFDIPPGQSTLAFQGPVGYVAMLGQVELAEQGNNFDEDTTIDGREPQARTELFHFTNLTNTTQNIRIGTDILGLNPSRSPAAPSNTASATPMTMANRVQVYMAKVVALYQGGGATKQTHKRIHKVR